MILRNFDKRALVASVLGVVGLVGFGVAAFAEPQQNLRDAAPAGGWGGSPFRVGCSTQLLVGFNYRRGADLDGIEPVCATFNAQGQRISEIRGNGVFIGGRGGDADSILCPEDMAVRGLRYAVQMPLVNLMELKCMNPATGAEFLRTFVFKSKTVIKFNVPLPNFTTARPIEFFEEPRFECQGTELAWGVHGRAGAMIDQLGLICKGGARWTPPPPAAAPPPPPQPVATVPGGSTSFVIRRVGTPKPSEPTLDDRRRCRAYADRAVVANATVASNACNLSGPRHEATLGQHMTFCLSATQELVMAEERAREQEVAACVTAKQNAQPSQE